jgi:hypothetical protein
MIGTLGPLLQQRRLPFFKHQRLCLKVPPRSKEQSLNLSIFNMYEHLRWFGPEKRTQDVWSCTIMVNRSQITLNLERS